MTAAEDFISTATVAEILGESARTVVRKAQTGQIPIAVKAPGIRGAYLFDRAAIEALAKGEVAA